MKEDKRKIGEDYNDAEPALNALDHPKIHKGLVGLYVDESLITYIDGVDGKLYYRGYPVKELCENSTFEEVAYLLIHGKLPSNSEFKAFKDLLIK